MPPKKKSGRRAGERPDDDSTSYPREQELEAEVARLKKELRTKERKHGEDLQAAGEIDISHYYQLLDENAQLQEQLRSKPDEASGTLDDQSQEESSEENQHQSVAVLPKELRPPRDSHTLQLIAQYTRMKEDLTQRKEAIAKARHETAAAIETAKQQIRDIQSHIRLAESQEQKPTQRHIPQSDSAHDQPSEPSHDTHLASEPPPLATYPELPSKHQTADTTSNFHMLPSTYSNISQSSNVTLKFTRYNARVIPEKNNEQKTTRAVPQEKEQGTTQDNT